MCVCLRSHKRTKSIIGINKHVQPWPLETLSPTFPPAPVVVFRRSNFNHPDQSRYQDHMTHLWHATITLFMLLKPSDKTALHIYSIAYKFKHNFTYWSAGPWFLNPLLDLVPAALQEPAHVSLNKNKININVSMYLKQSSHCCAHLHLQESWRRKCVCVCESHSVPKSNLLF